MPAIKGSVLGGPADPWAEPRGISEQKDLATPPLDPAAWEEHSEAWFRLLRAALPMARLEAGALLAERASLCAQEEAAAEVQER